MRPQYLLLFLLLLPISAAADCIGYVDEFDVIVTDSGLRAIEGAGVQVTYDRGSSFGEIYYTTPVQYTGKDGKLHFLLRNQGTNTREIDCEIAITASDSGVEETVTITANIHADLIMVQLPLYQLRVRVHDQYDSPLENASVSIEGVTKKTNGDGRAFFYVPEGEYSYLVNYLTGKNSGNVVVANDESFEVQIAFNPIYVDVVDDTGTPLESTLMILNDTFELPEGHFEYDKVFGEEIDYTIVHSGVEKTGVIYPESERQTMVVYDTHPPVFGTIETAGNGGLTRLSIQVTDEGKYASGLDHSTITVSYKLMPTDSGTPWSSATTFASSVDTFMADFPELPENSIVMFRAEAKDNEGNKATIDGRFSPYVEPPPDNGDGNGDGTQENGGEEQEIPFLYIVGGAFIVFLVVFFVIRIKSGGE